MVPVEPLNCWLRHLAYEDKDPKTLREYAYIVRRFVAFLHARGSHGLLEATESDLAAYRRSRTELQASPVGEATWGKEAQLLNQLYRWLVEHGWLRHRPLRLTHKGRNPLAPRLRRGMDIRHMTLAQYRYFRDVGLAGQLPSAEAGPGMRPSSRCRRVRSMARAARSTFPPELWTRSRRSRWWSAPSWLPHRHGRWPGAGGSCSWSTASTTRPDGCRASWTGSGEPSRCRGWSRCCGGSPCGKPILVSNRWQYSAVMAAGCWGPRRGTGFAARRGSGCACTPRIPRLRCCHAGGGGGTTPGIRRTAGLCALPWRFRW